VGVACDLGYACAKFRLPRPLRGLGITRNSAVQQAYLLLELEHWSFLSVNRTVCDGITAKNGFCVFASLILNFGLSRSNM